MYTAKQIAEIIGQTERNIQLKAADESWPFTKRKGRGGGRLFAVEDLPADIREEVKEYERNVALSAIKQTIAAVETAALEKASSFPVRSRSLAPAVKKPAQYTLDINSKKEGVLKGDLVSHYNNALRRAANKGHAREGFMAAYHAGAYPDLLREIGPISWKTIERWKLGLQRSGDAFSLADRRGLALRGRSSLTEIMKQTVLRLALHPNRVRLSTCITMTQKMLQAQGAEHVPSDATFRRFLNMFQERNQDVWVFCREGQKAWNDKVAMYLDRDLSVLQVGDILVADGHRLNFQVVNPFTGKFCRALLVCWYDMASNYPLGWELSLEETTQAIVAAMRRAHLVLGKPGKVAYLDNGRAEKSSFFTGDLQQSGVAGLFGRLGMETTFAWAYHGQSKTVERFFGYLKQMEELMPGGTGSCIDLKPAYQKRGEFAHRKIWEASGTPVMTMQEAHRAIASWVDFYVQQPQPRSHLEGRCPREVFEAGRGDGLSEEHLWKLRECMLQARKRQVVQCQVKLPGSLVGSAKEITYQSTQLYARKHDVLVKYDPQDLSSVDVYELDGAYICTAPVKGKQHPAARILGTEEDQRMLQLNLEMRKHAEKMAGAKAMELLQGEILPGYQASMERMGLAGGTVQPENSTQQIVSGRPIRAAIPELSDEEFEAEMAEHAAIRAEDALKAEAKIQEEDDDYEPRIISLEEQFWSKVSREPKEAERYELILEAEAQGMEIPKTHRDFCRYFEKTEEYSHFEGYFEERRKMYAMTYSRRESLAVAQ